MVGLHASQLEARTYLEEHHDIDIDRHRTTHSSLHTDYTDFTNKPTFRAQSAQVTPLFMPGYTANGTSMHCTDLRFRFAAIDCSLARKYLFK